MPDSFFETGKFVFVYRQLLDEPVEIASLISEVYPQAYGIVNNDDCENRGESENSRSGSLIISERGQNRDDEAGMETRHMAVGEKIFPLDPVLPRKNDELHGEQNSADDQRHNYHVVIFPVHT